MGLQSLRTGLAVCPLFLIALPAFAQDSVYLGAKEASFTEVAETYGDDVSEAAARWANAADSIEATVHVVADGRVVYVTRSTKRKLKKELALIEDSVKRFDALLPARPAATLEGAETTRGRMPDPTDDEVLVLLQPRDEGQYEILLDEVVSQESYLDSWRDSALGLQGFTITKPKVAMWLEQADGQEEYDVRNELVHRLTHLLVASRFGEIPFWLQTGISWHFEEETLGGIYCFPYRNEFVYATEHGAWDKELATAFKSVKGADDYFEGLAGWKRGSFQREEARQAFGMARFLLKHHREELPQLLSNLFHVRATEGVKSRGSGWTLIPGWEPDAMAQRAQFEGVLGEGVLSEAAKYFAKGKRYKKPRKRR